MQDVKSIEANKNMVIFFILESLWAIFFENFIQFSFVNTVHIGKVRMALEMP